MPNSVAANGGKRPEPLALVFPGQGSQSLGMAGKVIRVHPQVRERFETASEILGYDLLEVIERGPEASLGDTWHSQPAIYTASIAWLDALKVTWARNGRHLKPVAMAGHSLGQVTALVAAGALDFESGLVLVKERGPPDARGRPLAAWRDGVHHRPSGSRAPTDRTRGPLARHSGRRQ